VRIASDKRTPLIGQVDAAIENVALRQTDGRDESAVWYEVAMAKVTKPAKAGAKSKAVSKSASKSKAPAAKARPPAKPAAKARAVKAVAEAEAAPAAPEAPETVAADLLGEAERALLAKLVLKTGLAPREVVARALQAFGAANAWASKTASASVKAPGSAAAAVAADNQAPRRLLVSVDGKPAIAIDREPFVVGSGEECDLRIQLPLIAPKHAQILVREGRHIFEDLQSPRGSYLHGQRIDVRHLEDGDEIDLGGFLPLRFKLA
jgi:hypothetical protein